jgi:hypothetical protein
MGGGAVIKSAHPSGIRNIQSPRPITPPSSNPPIKKVKKRTYKPHN